MTWVFGGRVVLEVKGVWECEYARTRIVGLRANGGAVKFSPSLSPFLEQVR